MKKMIVTTTINPVTDAIKLYDAMEDWKLLVIGDKKTPVDYYSGLLSGKFLPWTYVEATYPDLVRLIGWNSVRLGRMVAFIEAYRRGADIIASIDDDCLPMENWGKNVYVGKPTEVTYYELIDEMDPWHCFDPYPGMYSPARGVPIEQIHDKGFCFEETIKTITPLIQVDACLGQGDFYAFARLANPTESMEHLDALEWPCAANAFSPINTQNTFIHRSVLKDFPANIPFIGRADDIWAGYGFQAIHKDATIYCGPSAVHCQDRSIASILDDLQDEMFLYRNTGNFLKYICQHDLRSAIEQYAPRQAVTAISLYRSYFDEKV